MYTKVEDDKLDGADSSTVPTDATPDSSTGTTTTADSSTAAGDKEPSSIAEALEKVQLEQPEEAGAKGSDAAGEQKTEDSPSTEKTESGKAPTDEAAGKKDGQPAAEGEADDLDVPFRERPEWKSAWVEINKAPGAEKIKLAFRDAFQRETRARDQVRTLQPRAQAAEELRQLVGGDKEFENMRQVVRQFAIGDPAVLPVLRQMVQTIEQSSGEVITSQDLVQRQATLQQQLDSGSIDEAEFKAQVGLLQEVERTRASKRHTEGRLQATTQQQQQQAAQAASQAQVTAINSWETNIRSRDPDFGDVTDVNDPKHGESIADQVFDAMTLKVTHKPTATTEELLSAGQRAYELAKRRAPGPVLRQQRAVTSQSSSPTGQKRPKTMREAMDAVKLE